MFMFVLGLLLIGHMHLAEITIISMNCSPQQWYVRAPSSLSLFHGTTSASSRGINLSHVRSKTLADARVWLCETRLEMLSLNPIKPLHYHTEY